MHVIAAHLMSELIIPQRLRNALKHRGMTQSELARRIGVSQGSINHILAGNTQKSKYLSDIARELRVPVSWLEGGEDQFDLAAQEDVRDHTIMLQEVDIGYAMGGGTFIEDSPDVAWRAFDPHWLRDITNSGPNLLFVAKGIGDSMFPTLHHADTIIVDRGRRRLDQQDRVWALTYGGLGMVKRVRAMPNGRLLIVSDNPTVTDFEADADDLTVIGRVCWVGRQI